MLRVAKHSERTPSGTWSLSCCNLKGKGKCYIKKLLGFLAKNQGLWGALETIFIPSSVNHKQKVSAGH